MFGSQAAEQQRFGDAVEAAEFVCLQCHFADKNDEKKCYGVTDQGSHGLLIGASHGNYREYS